MAGCLLLGGCTQLPVAVVDGWIGQSVPPPRTADLQSASAHQSEQASGEGSGQGFGHDAGNALDIAAGIQAAHLNPLRQLRDRNDPLHALQRAARGDVNATKPLGVRVALNALAMIGTRYRYGGETPDEGFDCSGLVQYSYGLENVPVPRTSRRQYDRRRPITRAHLQPGDLVFFKPDRRISHVGIYLGNGEIVHAPRTGGVVRVESLNGSWFRRYYAGAGRPY
ncbi:MAG: C40 family peptidase [Gammaproteobacteria bacterium]|nr:C40 family peptidase [Gammaproteobacteria bacterium]